jgi:hypothetical protein
MRLQPRRFSARICTEQKPPRDAENIRGDGQPTWTAGNSQYTRSSRSRQSRERLFVSEGGKMEKIGNPFGETRKVRVNLDAVKESFANADNNLTYERMEDNGDELLWRGTWYGVDKLGYVVVRTCDDGMLTFRYRHMAHDNEPMIRVADSDKLETSVVPYILERKTNEILDRLEKQSPNEPTPTQEQAQGAKYPKRETTQFRQIEIGKQMTKMPDWQTVQDWIERNHPQWKRSRTTIFRAQRFYSSDQIRVRRKSQNKNDTD